jgi:hypothetical protein
MLILFGGFSEILYITYKKHQEQDMVTVDSGLLWLYFD